MATIDRDEVFAKLRAIAFLEPGDLEEVGKPVERIDPETQGRVPETDWRRLSRNHLQDYLTYSTQAS